MLSRRGRCFAFDERADGYVRGEGGGVIILKPLAQALADGDRIRAVILGTGVNSDGRTIGLSLPSEAAQARADPHGIRARRRHARRPRVFRDARHRHAGRRSDRGRRGRTRARPEPARAAADRLGQDQYRPSRTGLRDGRADQGGAGARPRHRAADAALRDAEPENPVRRTQPAARARRSSRSRSGRCAGVNSFGFGGTNGHAVLARRRRTAARRQKPPLPKRTLPPLVISARTEASLRTLAQSWRDTLAAAPAEAVASLLRGAARRREHHPQRLVALGADRADTVAALADFAAGDRKRRRSSPEPRVRDGQARLRVRRQRRAVAGHGARRLSRECRVPRRGRRGRCGPVRPALGWSVGEMLEARRRRRAAGACRHRAAAALRGAGRHRHACCAGSGSRRPGISATASARSRAAWAAGALSLADAARVVVARSRQQERTRGRGRMAALALGADGGARASRRDRQPARDRRASTQAQSVTLSGPERGDRPIGSRSAPPRRCLPRPRSRFRVPFGGDGPDPRRSARRSCRPVLQARRRPLLISTVTGDPVGVGRTRRRVLVAQYPQPGPVCRRHGRGWSATVSASLSRSGPTRCCRPICTTRCAPRKAQGRVLGTLDPQAGGRGPVSGNRRPLSMSRDMTSSGPRGSTAPPSATGCRSIRGTRSGSGSSTRSRPATWSTRPSTIRCSASASRGRCRPGSIISMPTCCRGSPTTRSRGCRCCRPPRSSRWRWPRRGCAARMRAASRSVDVELRRPLPFDKGRPARSAASSSAEDGDWELSSRPRLADEPPTLHAVARLATAGDFVPPPLFGPAEPGRGRDGRRRALWRSPPGSGLITAAGSAPSAHRAAGRRTRRWRTSIRRSSARPLAPLSDPSRAAGRRAAGFAGADRRSASMPILTASSFLPWRFGRVRVAGAVRTAPARARLRVTRIGTRSASADIALFDEAGADRRRVVGLLVPPGRADPPRPRPKTARLRIDLVPAPLGETRRRPCLRRDRRYCRAAGCMSADADGRRASTNRPCCSTR